MSACRVHSGAPGFAAVERLNAYRGLTHAYQNAGGDNELILYDTARAMADRDRYVPPEPELGPPDDGDLDSPRVWLFLARDAERRTRDRLAGRVEAALRDGQDAFTAWNGNLALARRTATACADRIILEILAAASGTGPKALGPVLRLHALDRLERRAAVLLDEGVVPPGILDELGDARRRTCDELAPARRSWPPRSTFPPPSPRPPRSWPEGPRAGRKGTPRREFAKEAGEPAQGGYRSR
ncbi:hypothetical protein ACFQY7_10665 [Actinomadura luteofluorescens]|uniref:hypothetical protein n=1 Tax=Actinomadura luteofluorescens TaxID=46163 RepID=UPI00362A0526